MYLIYHTHFVWNFEKVFDGMQYHSHSRLVRFSAKAFVVGFLFFGRNIHSPPKCILRPNERAEYHKGVQWVRKWSNSFDYTKSVFPCGIYKFVLICDKFTCALGGGGLCWKITIFQWSKCATLKVVMTSFSSSNLENLMLLKSLHVIVFCFFF